MKFFILIGLLMIFLVCNAQSKSEQIKILNNSIDSIQIGTQTWMQSNLSTVLFQNGDTIPEVRSTADWIKTFNEGKPAWCYYGNNSKNERKYGRLYNWYAVVDSRNLCPTGWRIPTILDFQKLLLINHSIDEIEDLMDEGCPYCGLLGLNSNFSGARNSDGSFDGLENILKMDGASYLRGSGNWWYLINNNQGFISDSDDGNTANTWFVNVDKGVSEGMSVRCVKD